MNNTKIEPKVLSGMQSVRTTFNISETSVAIIQAMSKMYKIKPKDIFDILFNDNNSYLEDNLKERAKRKREQKKKKTYVISKKSLDWLNAQSKKRKTSRDTLVECSLWGFSLIIKEKKKEREKKEKEAAKIIDHFNEVFNMTTEKLINLFGEDDDFIQGWYEGACEFQNWEIFETKAYLDDMSKNGDKENDNN